MLVLIDDIKLRSEREFFSYISKEFNDAYIDGFGGLEEYLMNTGKEIEFILSDFDELEDSAIADRLVALLERVCSKNKKIAVTEM